MKIIELDGSEMRTKWMAHCYLKKQLENPEYYGENLDALWDVLSSISLPTTIQILHRDILVEQLGAYGESLIDVFCQAALENRFLLVEIKS